MFYPSSHFLGRLRSALQKAEKHGSTRLNKNHKHDLQLWLSFIACAHSGVSMNLLTFRVPTRFKRTDACGYGLGGCDLKTGRAWRWIIPTHLQGLPHKLFGISCCCDWHPSGFFRRPTTSRRFLLKRNRQHVNNGMAEKIELR